jgi:hypothetical protein
LVRGEIVKGPPTDFRAVMSAVVMFCGVHARRRNVFPAGHEQAVARSLVEG